MCRGFLDAPNGGAEHIVDLICLAAVAQAEPDELAALGRLRRWERLRLLSAAANSDSRDYGVETPDGGPRPIANVWTLRSGELRRFRASEMFTANTLDWPHHPSHVNMLRPLWNVFDLTPEGAARRGFRGAPAAEAGASGLCDISRDSDLVSPTALAPTFQAMQK